MQQRNLHLRVVRDNKEKTDERRDGSQSKKISLISKISKIKSNKKIVAGVVALAVVIVAVFLFIYLQTYTKVRVLETYKIGSAADNSYEEFIDGVLKYSRDGISYLNQNGEEQWNQPYQMKSPFVDVNKESAAIADRGGNDIMVFGKEGLKGEIRTTLPIERIAVSEQGIVAAILKNESSPRIICYDTAGNVLVEHKASLTGVGYPLDIALSSDGTVMQAVYLSVNNGEMVSKVCYYNFGKAGEDKTDHQVAGKEYKDSVIAAGFFVGDSTSAVVGDNCITIFKGKDVPEEKISVSVKGEIQSIFHNDKYIGLILKNEGKSGYELCLFNSSGKEVLSETFEGTYKSVKMSGNQVIMYDGKKCNIFTRSGMHRFEGEMDNNILEIFPVGGINKYIVMNANGMETIRLVK
ncbi:MAG: DUF5711 family protein [Lachnospiraceae bacterium]